MRKRMKKVSSLFLIAAIACTSILGMLPTLKVEAATKNMAHLKAGANNANGHFGSAQPEAFVLSPEKGYANEDFSFEIKLNSEKADTRFRFVTKYVDDSNWAYIAYDGASTANTWFYEYKNGGDAGWPNLGAMPMINKGDVVKFTGDYQADKLTLTIENKTTEESGSVDITDAKFMTLAEKQGQVGFGAATYGAQYTDVYFSDVVVGTKTYSEDDYASWSLYKEIDGQVWEPKVAVEIGGNEPVDPPVETEGRTWWKVTGGSNNGGGHAYGDPDKAAPVTLLNNDKKMETSASISLALKPSNNWGVFHTYVDDNNWLYVGHDSSSNWYYQYKYAGKESYPKIAGLPAPVEGQEMKMTIALNRETLSISVDGVSVNVTNQDLIKFDEATNGKGRFGVKTNGATTISFADFTYNGENCMEDAWVFAAERTGQIKEKEYSAMAPVSGTITDKEDGKPLAGATVRFGPNATTTNEQGKFIFADKLEAKTYNVAVTMPGYQAYSEQLEVLAKTDNVFTMSIAKKLPLDLTKFDTIQSSDMKVYIGKNFPLVARYEMNDGKYFRGNETELDTVDINGVSIKPTVSVKSTVADARVYSLIVKDEASKIDFTMDVKVSVKENTLTWEVVKIDKAEGCVKIATIDIPNLSLLSVDAVDKEANFAGAKSSTTTTVSGDVFQTFADGFIPSDREGYLYGFLSTNELSAGLFSNSEVEGDERVVRKNGADTMTLTSAAWYHELGDKLGQKRTELSDKYPVSELPITKVVVTGDANDDATIDWNDGALGFRKIMNIPYGSENIKEMVNNRIVMNFASMASNPYLVTADNIKKVYLATDGLPQAVMLKGYGNEGHDSANSEYADIAERQGGVEDFQELIKIAHEYDTEIGIHVNAQEAYPEAASFHEDMLQKPFGGGWSWLDQSQVIDKQWDLATQARWKRFVQLYDRINGTSYYSREWPNAVINSLGEVTASKEEIKKDAESRKDNMDFIYLDVWYQESWETRQIAKEINSLGWRFSTEFSDQGEYDSTWQHWATDAPYGGATSKGFNSDIIRFIRNDQRDSQVLNYPQYGGAADNPLLGGHHLYGFEGWGGDKDFNNYIVQTYNTNLPTKFLQHYYVTDWETYAEGQSPTGNHEKEITLKNDEGDKVVVTRKEEQRSDENIERIITLNGKKVLDDVTYLLPWTEEDGSEKLYHWNLEGGTTSWDLQDDWTNLANVKVYELSDQGRINLIDVPVVDGKVTLTAKAKTAYVVDKGENVKTLAQNFGQSDYVVDPGFNAYVTGDKLATDVWSGDITDESVVVEKANTGDQRLAFNSPKKDVAVTTTISGLTPGKDYVAEVYVENNSDAKATIEVNAGSKQVSNYTERSILMNYVKSDQKNGSKMQRMQISFVAESTTAKLTLSRAAGEGSAYMDDIRIVDKKLDNFKADGSFEQDFETVVQGLYPFVLSFAQGINDPATHLSQLNAPYTQKGWNGRVIDDVIDGNWSVKHHNSNTGILYQTLPQNYRFEPGKVYTVEFDYQSGPDKAYAMVVGNGTSYVAPQESDYLAKAHGQEETQHVKMNVVGDANGQTWIGIYENGSRAPGEDKMGLRDFTLDNLKIKEDPSIALAAISNKNLFKGETATILGNRLDEITWKSSDDTIATVDVQNKQVKALKAGVVTLTATLPDNTTQTFEIIVKDAIIEDIPKEELVPFGIEANTEQASGEGPGSGIKGAIIDGDSSTYWHSNWSTKFVVSEENPAILTIDLGKEMDIQGFKFQQRPTGGDNGKIQQFSYIARDAVGNEVARGDKITVDAEGQRSGAWFATLFEQNTKATGLVKTVEISIEKGYNDFAAMAEFLPVAAVKVAETATLKNLSVSIDETKDIEVTVPENTVLKGGVWTSSDNSVAIVTQEGKVTGIGVGTATITLTNAAGLKAECTVTVIGTLEDLEAAVKKAEALREENYTTSTWKAVADKLAAAKAVLADADATVAEIQTATVALNTAMTGLERKVAPYVYEAIKANVAEFKALEADYTAAEFADMKAAITAAETLLKKDVEDISAKAANTVNGNLLLARLALKDYGTSDALFENLKLVIEIANDLLASDEVIDARPGQLTALKTEVVAGQALIDANSKDRLALKTAVVKITKATQELYKIVDKTSLQSLVTIAETEKAKDIYTTDSVAKLDAAITEAKAVIANDNATEKEVSDAYAKLEKAIKGLVVEESVDKGSLANQIEIANSIMANKDKYIASTIAGLDKILADAIAVFENEKATQAEVNAATKALTAANMKARVKADKEALADIIAKANAIDLSKYTVESAINLRKALLDGQKILSDENATQEQVDASVKAIQTAMKGLTKPTNGGTGTGDTTNTLIWFVLLAGSLAALSVQKKLRNND